MKPTFKHNDLKVYLYTCNKCKRIFRHAFRIYWPERNQAIGFRLEDDENSPKHLTYPSRHGKCPTPGCGGWGSFRVVKARVNDTPCDARCTHAHGPECNCSCGGVNHGKDL